MRMRLWKLTYIMKLLITIFSLFFIVACNQELQTPKENQELALEVESDQTPSDKTPLDPTLNYDIFEGDQVNCLYADLEKNNNRVFYISGGKLFFTYLDTSTKYFLKNIAGGIKDIEIDELNQKLYVLNLSKLYTYSLKDFSLLNSVAIEYGSYRDSLRFINNDNTKLGFIQHKWVASGEIKLDSYDEKTSVLSNHIFTDENEQGYTINYIYKLAYSKYTNKSYAIGSLDSTNSSHQIYGLFEIDFNTNKVGEVLITKSEISGLVFGTMNNLNASQDGKTLYIIYGSSKYSKVAAYNLENGSLAETDFTGYAQLGDYTYMRSLFFDNEKNGYVMTYDECELIKWNTDDSIEYFKSL